MNSKFNTKGNKILLNTMIIVLSTFIMILPLEALGLEVPTGEEIFSNNCAGCHINGGNIIRRKKTLKLNVLKKNGLDNSEAIARIAREGIGIMGSYEDVLNEGEDILVANWILDQAQKDWFHG